MKFIRNLLSRGGSDDNDSMEPLKSELRQKQPAMDDATQLNLKVVSEHAVDQSAPVSLLDQVNADMAQEAAPAPAAVNIWDMDGEDDSNAAAAAAAPAPRSRRNKTRLLGYEHLEDDGVTAFENAEKTAPTLYAKYPVGWVIVVQGPGRGTCFTLEAGMSQIGRGEDQAIQLDFGDNSISRMNHAAIVYDSDTHSFLLGHGGKKNIVRLNGTPVISNEDLASDDEVTIGETTLRFVAFSTPDFNWSDDLDIEENDNVAIA